MYIYVCMYNHYPVHKLWQTSLIDLCTTFAHTFQPILHKARNLASVGIYKGNPSTIPEVEASGPY